MDANQHLNAVAWRLSGAAAVLACGLCLAAPAAAQKAPYTPPRSSPERVAIMEGMRNHGDIRDRIFSVRSLKVLNGWAWFSGQPASRDGRNRYETENALLHNAGQGWKVVAQPCAEEGCSIKKEIARIRKAHPAAPAGIFPR